MQPEYLKILIKQHDTLTLRQIAALIGTQASTVMRIMDGTHTPRKSTIEKIKSAFDA